MNQISFLGVLLAALSAMVIGSIYYSKGLFGKKWQKMMNTSDKQMKEKMPVALIILAVVSLVTAYFLSVFMIYFHNFVGGSWLKAGFDVALFAWVGFAVTTIFAHGVFDPRDRRLMYINSGNRFITLVVMGLILSAFMN